MNKKILAALAAPACLLALTGCKGLAANASGPVSGVCDYAPRKKPSKKIGLTSKQKGYAETIILKGAEMGMPHKAAEVAITAALQESTLNNDVPPGDGGTAFGLFQMRPMYGWGSHAEVMNPDYSSQKFYKVLKKVKGWQFMSHADAAQAVERSADGSLYRDNVSHAKKIVARVSWEQCKKVKKVRKEARS